MIRFRSRDFSEMELHMGKELYLKVEMNAIREIWRDIDLKHIR